MRVDGAAAALFAAGIAARTKGPVVWCLTRPDLFFPALAQVGLHPDRVIFVESDREEDVLANMEEGLAFGGLGAVVGELVRLPMVGSRRLQLAAERTGTMALADLHVARVFSVRAAARPPTARSVMSSALPRSLPPTNDLLFERFVRQKRETSRSV